MGYGVLFCQDNTGGCYSVRATMYIGQIPPNMVINIMAMTYIEL